MLSKPIFKPNIQDSTPLNGVAAIKKIFVIVQCDSFDIKIGEDTVVAIFHVLCCFFCFFFFLKKIQICVPIINSTEEQQSMVELAKQKRFQSAIYDENASGKHGAIKILVQLSNALLLLNGHQLSTKQKFDTIAKCMKQQKEFKQMEKEIQFMSVEINCAQIDMLVLQQHLNKFVSILAAYDIPSMYVEGRVPSQILGFYNRCNCIQ